LQTTKALKDIQDGLRQRANGDSLTALRLAVQCGRIDVIAESIATLNSKSYHEEPSDQWSKVVMIKPPKSTNKFSSVTHRTVGVCYVTKENGAIQQDADEPTHSKKIRERVIINVIGEHEVGMRQTKSGELLIEIKGDSERVEAVRAEVSKSAGTDVEVISLQRKTLIEI